MIARGINAPFRSQTSSYALLESFYSGPDVQQPGKRAFPSVRGSHPSGDTACFFHCFPVPGDAVHFYLWGCFLARPPPEKQNIMNKKHTNHHLLKINYIKTESYNMMMMHEKSKMRHLFKMRTIINNYHLMIIYFILRY